MLQTRRGFIVTGTAGTIGAMAFGEEGCSFGSALSELETYLPVGLQAFAGVVAIINPPAGSALEAATVAVPKVWAAITAAINNYNAAGKTGTLGGVIAALQAGEGAITAVFDALSGVVNVPATDLQAAQAVLLLISTTLAAIQAKLGSAPATAAPVARVKPSTVRTVGRVQIDVQGTLSAKDFKQKYFAVMEAAGHPERKL